MALLIEDPAEYLTRHLDKRRKVLLVNPPVQERRYHWLRWNQPADLLRLSSLIKRAHRGIDVRLFDFMLPDEKGAVSKHKVKDTWTGSVADDQLWHFGRTYEMFERRLSTFKAEGWLPDLIIISSLTSYWHVSIEKLLVKLCNSLDKKRRKATTICLYGNYPKLEPAHAAQQADADVAFTAYANTRSHAPDFSLYISAEGRLPAFCALDIDDPDVDGHLNACLEQHGEANRARGISRPPSITVAFFNEDVCSPASQLDKVAGFTQRYPKQVAIEGVSGINPRSLSADNLFRLKHAGFRSLFVEHARLQGGGIDTAQYEPLLSFLRAEEHAKKSGRPAGTPLTRNAVTGFVAMGLPDDNIDDLVRSTLTVNRYFQAVILKPFGYSPSLDPSSERDRRLKWPMPRESSPQWFPYVTHGSRLAMRDYENLIRWQNVLNTRVKGATFDFLDDGRIAALVRETLVGESWKRHREVR